VVQKTQGRPMGPGIISLVAVGNPAPLSSCADKLRRRSLSTIPRCLDSAGLSETFVRLNMLFHCDPRDLSALLRFKSSNRVIVSAINIDTSMTMR